MANMMKLILLCGLVLLLASCAAPITREEVQNTTYDCTNVDTKLSELNEEKEKNNKRVLSGVKSVMPVGAVVGIVQGRYKENVAIATGEWAEILDEKILEMQNFQAQCAR